MFQCIAILVIFIQIVQVCPRVILNYDDTEARLLIHPPQLFLDAFTGRPLNLLCNGESKNGGTFTDFKWLDPQREIFAEGTPGVKQMGENALMLAFVDPTVDDSGVYKCTATYRNQEYLEAEISVLFHEDIKFENCSEYQVLFNNEKGEITCIPVSKQPLTVAWTKDDKKLETGRFVFTESGITINTANEEDAGEYVIEAFEPRTGTLKLKNITVEIFNRDSENDTGIIQGLSVPRVTKDTVFFRIQSRGNVKNIEIKYRESLDGTDKNITWKLGDIFAVRNLTPSGQYIFRFRATPLESISWSQTVKVTLLPAVPDVILRLLNGDMLEIEWLRTVQDIQRNSIDKYQLVYQPIQELQNGWSISSCNVTIDISTSCFVSVYKIANLKRATIYDIRVKAHTSAGYGDAYTQKVQLA